MTTKTIDIGTLLGDLDAGVFNQRLEAAMRDTAMGVVTTGKKGDVTVKFSLERIGDSSQVTCTHSIKFKKPTAKGNATEEATTKTPLHVGTGGVLSLFPESQPDMFARGDTART